MEALQRALSALVEIIGSFALFWGSMLAGFTHQNTQSIPAPIEETAQEDSSFPVAGNTSSSTMAKAVSKTLPRPADSSLPASSVSSKTQEEVNEQTRAALVNILCLPQTGLSGISGSGILIDSRGVILTNAHVAQFFLLKDYLRPDNIRCTIRIGSPAQERYTATLLYIPPAWITANASQIKATQASGTGEHDYAFLLITGRTNPSASLPETFPRLEMIRSYPRVGDPMLLAAYPAGFLSSEILQKSLYASSAVTYVTQLFSFDEKNQVDLFSIGGTIVSQAGSSGGAAVRLSDGKLLGVISTATVGVSTGERDLRAVSLAHIDDSLAAAGEGGVSALLTGDLSVKAQEFNTATAPGLIAQLEAVLKGQ